MSYPPQILPDIKRILYVILCYSIIINSFTWISWEHHLAWLVYLESFVLAGNSIPFWILAVFLFRDTAFKWFLCIRILDVFAISARVYDWNDYLVVNGYTLRDLVTALAITMNLITIYYILLKYKWS